MNDKIVVYEGGGVVLEREGSPNKIEIHLPDGRLAGIKKTLPADAKNMSRFFRKRERKDRRSGRVAAGIMVTRHKPTR